MPADALQSSEELRIETRDQVLWLTITREARRNAMSHSLLAQLDQVLREAPLQRNWRAIVLTGSGDKAFCAGADLQAGKAFTTDYSDPHGHLAQVLRAAQTCTLPLIARVNGACMAGGMGLLAINVMRAVSEYAPSVVRALEAVSWPEIGVPLGRLLPGDDRPVAQFMYQEASGKRLTLYVSARAKTDAQTAFRIAQEGSVSVFYWIDGRYGYALSGDLAPIAITPAPARSSACSMVSQVRTPKPTAQSASIDTWATPFETSLATYSKCGVPPRTTTPRATTASAPPGPRATMRSGRRSRRTVCLRNCFYHRGGGG